MAFHFSAKSGVIGALLLAAGCMSGEGTGASPELAGGGGSGGLGSGASALVTVTSLTGDQPGLAPSVESSLVNAWGIVSFQGWFWITDNATGKLSILDGAGHAAGAQPGGTGTGGGSGMGSGQSGQGSGSDQSGVGQGSGSGQGMGTINVASGSIDLGEGITGIAVNDSTAMQMDGTGANAQACGPANLIVASEHGQLIGVNTSLNMTGGQVLVDRSKAAASYTGVAVLDVKAGATCSASGGTCDTGTGMGNGQGSGSGSSDNGTGMGSGSGNQGTGYGSGSGSSSSGTGSGSGTTSGTGNGNGNGNGGTGNVPQPGVLVLAADFHNARIDVFDEKFNLVTTPMFSAPASIPAGFAPFNVAVINGIVYVTYAQQNDTKDDSVAGAGLGFVVAFDVCGNMLWTAKGDQLNAPWGLAMGGDLSLAPGVLLVGNFGDGHITELNPKDGTIIAQLMTADRTPVMIDGLWGLAIGTASGVQSAQPGGVYFASGPQDEAHGLFGVIAPAAAAAPGPGSGSGSNM